MSRLRWIRSRRAVCCDGCPPPPNAANDQAADLLIAVRTTPRRNQRAVAWGRTRATTYRPTLSARVIRRHGTGRWANTANVGCREGPPSRPRTSSGRCGGTTRAASDSRRRPPGPSPRPVGASLHGQAPPRLHRTVVSASAPRRRGRSPRRRQPRQLAVGGQRAERERHQS